jgi:hypothetical protein
VRLLGAVFAVTAAALCAVPLLPEQPAMASCVGPTVKFKPSRITRGGVLTITGQYFGDDCLDTGTVPPGVEPLGSPLTGLAIVIDQGEREFLVATGSADSDYEFQVDIVVPSELEPGEATLSIIGAGDARLPISPALVISTAPPLDSAETTVATFGPPSTSDTQPPGSVPPPILPADIPDEPVDTAPPLSAVPIEADTTDSSGVQRAISVGVAGVVAIGALGFALWSRSRRRN